MPKTLKMIPRRYAHPVYKWVVRVPKALLTEGDKPRRYFKTRELADTFVEEKRGETFQHGTSSQLPASVRSVVAEELRHLPTGHTVNMVFDAYRQTLKNSRETVGQLLDGLLQVREASVGSKTIATYRSRALAIRRIFGQRVAAELTAREIDAWLATVGAKQTIKHYRVFFFSVFEFGGIEPNPMRRSSFRNLQIRRDPPKVYLPYEMRTMLDVALEERNWQMLAFLALGGFAHVRPAELLRLHWSFIEEKEIAITEVTAKVKSAQRTIKIHANLRAWLDQVPPSKRRSRVLVGIKDDIELVLWRRALIKKVQARLQERRVNGEKIRRFHWLYDGLRHSSCSYHLKHFENRGELIEEMGHTDAETMIDHYRNAAVKKELAKEWYEIIPGPEDKPPAG